MAIRIQVFDPPMCCSSGVCGPTVDPSLSQFAADVEWLRKQGITVDRYNLSQQPEAFVHNPLVMNAFQKMGDTCLPLVIVDGQIVSQGEYPSRKQLVSLVESSVPLESTENSSLQQCILALQQGKMVLVAVQNASTKWNEEAMQGITEFASDPRFYEVTEIIQIDSHNTDERDFIDELGIDLDSDQAITAFLIPPGVLAGIFPGETTKEMFITSLQTALSSCGCGPGGCGS